MQTISILSEADQPKHPKTKIPRSTDARIIYTGYLSGMVYYDYGFACILLRKGTQLTFCREPKNPYDTYAIAVWYKTWKLGYIPKNQNEILANMLDQDMPLKIRVRTIDPSREEYGGGLGVEVVLSI